MAFVAPMAGRAAAGAAARSGGARATGKAAAGKAAATKGASTAWPDLSGAATAADRARELVKAGKSRPDAARVLRDEYGSTLAEADALVAATSSTGEAGGAVATPPTSPATPPRRQAPHLPGAKAIGQTVDAGGGILLGSLGYVLLMAYLHDGSAGVKRWLKAKFLNQVEAR